MNPFSKIRDIVMKSNFSRAVLSIFLAVLIWLVISVSQYPFIQSTIYDVPLTVDITGTTAGDNGLSVISCDTETVTVELLGSRTKVGILNNSNIEAYIDTSSVTTVGTKTLPIKIRSSSGIDFEIKSITPETAAVMFDKYESRDFPVYAKIPNVTYAEGKSPDDLICDPDTVTITGPSAQLDKIDKCYAVSNKTLSLDTTYTLASDEIQLYTEDNGILDQSSLKFSAANINITIPVRTQKEVPLTVSIYSAPGDFDQSCLKFNMSADSIVLATNNSSAEIPDPLNIGYVLLSDLDLGYSKTFKISSVLDNTVYDNVSGIETVTVSLDGTGLQRTVMNLDKSRITLSNPPDSSYTYSILSQNLQIAVIGPEDIIPDITAEDIIADVNLLNADIATDQFSAYVSFSCPKYDNVWVATNSKVTVQRTKIETPTTAAATAAAE